MMEKKKWIRNCPECGKEMSYAFDTGLIRANKNNSLCNSCARKGKRNPFYGKDHSDEVKKACGDRFRGHVKSKEHIQKWKKTIQENGSLSGKNNPMYGKTGELNPFYGKKHSEETLTEIRLKRIEQVKERVFNGGQMYPNYNPSSIPIIEAKANELGITDLQHAENGGEFFISELGYWVDGYSKEKNVVIEFDEAYHFDSDGNLTKKDIKRQKEIEKYLGCEFIRISQ